jgi:hypothetical protein
MTDTYSAQFTANWAINLTRVSTGYTQVDFSTTLTQNFNGLDNAWHILNTVETFQYNASII